MRERGSITLFFSLLLPLLLALLFILSDISQYHFQLQRLRSEVYLSLDDRLSGFHRELFHEMGILALEDVEGLAPLSERAVLEESILLLMKEARLRDGLYWAEDLVGEFLRNKAGIELELFDLSQLNRELSDIVEKAKKGEISEAFTLNFFTKVLAMEPYIRLEGMKVEQLKQAILQGDKETLEAVNPLFVLEDSLRETYEKWNEALEKYDVLNILGSYALADYGVDYLGYSMTKMDIEGLRSEYLLTGIEDQSGQAVLVKAHLYGLRLMFNIAECYLNPKIKNQIMSLCAGEPRLYALIALARSALESGSDVYRIMNREKVPLYKGEQGFSTFGKSGRYSSGWTYPSYLKLLLGLTPKEIYFSRLQKALEVNYGVDLNYCFTALEEKKKLHFKGKILPFSLEKEVEGRLYYVRP